MGDLPNCFELAGITIQPRIESASPHPQIQRALLTMKKTTIEDKHRSTRQFVAEPIRTARIPPAANEEMTQL